MTSHTVLPEMPCRELVERVTDYLEGAIAPGDRLRLEEHLAECEDCELYLGQLERSLALAGELREDDVGPGMRDELLQAFSRWKGGA